MAEDPNHKSSGDENPRIVHFTEAKYKDFEIGKTKEDGDQEFSEEDQEMTMAQKSERRRVKEKYKKKTTKHVDCTKANKERSSELEPAPNCPASLLQ